MYVNTSYRVYYVAGYMLKGDSHTTPCLILLESHHSHFTVAETEAQSSQVPCCITSCKVSVQPKAQALNLYVILNKRYY